MKKKWINIRIETKSREFIYKMKLADVLMHKGYGVVIQQDFGGDVEDLPRGVYFINSIYKDSEEKLKEIKQRGNRIVLMDEEGLVIRNEKEYIRRLPDQCLRYVDSICCFGEYQADLIKRMSELEKLNIYATGNPRINILSSSKKIANQDIVDKIKREYGNFLLVISNFSTVNLIGSNNSYEDRLRIKKKIFQEMGLIRGEVEEQEFEIRFQYLYKLFTSFIDLVNEIGEKHKEINVVVRPHPSENRNIWDSIANKYENIHVVYDGNMINWLEAATLVVQNGCTSAIECLYMNRPCISYRPYVNEKYDQHIPNELSTNVYTKDKVIELAENICMHNQEFPYYDEYAHYKVVAEKYISNSQNNDSIDAIVEIIEKEAEYCSEDDFDRIKYMCINYSKKISFRFLKKNVKKILRNIIYFSLRTMKKTTNPLYVRAEDSINNERSMKNKMDGLTIEEIRKALYNEGIAEENIVVKRLKENTYILYQEK